MLEGVLARGDRKVASVVEEVYKNGAMFDSWGEYFNNDTWMQAFETCGVDPDFYTVRERNLDEIFPWDFIDAGVTKEFLKKREWLTALGEKVTPNCRQQCSAAAQENLEEVSALKIRIKFAKEGTMKFIGHLDIMRYFQKVMRRADVDIRYSEGFSPHQIMSFAAPLGVGLESRGEYVDIEVLSTDSSKRCFAASMRIWSRAWRRFPIKHFRMTPGNAMSLVAAADYEVPSGKAMNRKTWTHFCRDWTFLVQGRNRHRKKDQKGRARGGYPSADLQMEARPDHVIFLQIATGSAANLKPDAVLRDAESRGEALGEFVP